MRQITLWAKTSIFATLFVIALMLGVAAFLYAIDLPIYAMLMLVLLAAMCVVALCFMPTAFEVDDQWLTIIFPLRVKRIALSEIVEAKPFTEANRMWRVGGSGAFFGWWGWFTAKGYGKFMLYASNLDNLVYFRLANGKKYVISTSNSAPILEAIKQQ